MRRGRPSVGGARGVTAAQASTDRGARRSRASARRAEGSHLRAHRRSRRRRVDVAARERSAACATGTTGTAGCATPRSACSRCCPRGYEDEALAWRDWLLRAAAGAPSQLQIMYGIAGERRLPELELDWLPGYENSKPVRIGNGASTQFQLDVYGEVMDALYHASGRALRSAPTSGTSSSRSWTSSRARWKQPDEGIWEVRGPRRHFTHSKVMAWVAADRAVRSVEELGRDRSGATGGGSYATEIEKWILDELPRRARRVRAAPRTRRSSTPACSCSRSSGSCRPTTSESSPPSRPSIASSRRTGSSRRYRPNQDARRPPAGRGRVPAVLVLDGRRPSP